MKRDDVDRLLDCIGGLKHRCDVDLLVFFARHPRTLATSEQLATWLGYDLKQIAVSLDVLLGTGLLTRSQSSAHAARMYVLVVEDTGLPPLLEFASTRAGRLAIRSALETRSPDDRVGRPTALSDRDTEIGFRPRAFVTRRRPNEIPGTKSG